MEAAAYALAGSTLGALIGFFGNSLLQNQKRKDDRTKFILEHKVEVGEEFYENSGLALIKLQSQLNSIKKAVDYRHQSAQDVFVESYNAIVELLKQMITANTISSADVYFNVSTVDTANKMLEEVLTAEANFRELMATYGLEHFEELKIAKKNIELKLGDLINLIRTDRQTIHAELQKLVKKK